MYVITKQAAVWASASTDPVPPRTPRPQRIQCWAEKPLNTSSGAARAIRFDGEYARVLVERNGKRDWLPLDLVMNEDQARRWIKTGFPRGR